MSVTEGVVQAVIDDEHLKLGVKSLRERAERYHEEGYGKYATVLTDLATRIEKAQGDAIDDLAAVMGGASTFDARSQI